MRRLLLTLVLATTVLAPIRPGKAGDGADFRYRVDLTRKPAEVLARFPVREPKDFAFLTTLSGRSVTGLKVRDAEGDRQVTAAGPGIYRVDGLTPGTIEARYQLSLGHDCATGVCRDQEGVLLVGSAFLMHPLGVDPALHTPTRIEVIMPPSWSLVTAGGVQENAVEAPTLQAGGATALLAGHQVLERSAGGELLVIRSAGWEAGVDTVSAILGAVLREHHKLLGSATPYRPVLMLVQPSEPSQKAAVASPRADLHVLRLPGAGARATLAASLMEPMVDLFQAQLDSGLAGATSPDTRWWRVGFAEYTSLLAAIRSGALPEQRLIERLWEAWRHVGKHSPLAGQTTLAGAGHLEGGDAEAYVRHGGVLACFLLDIRIRSMTSQVSGLGELLASTRGRDVDNALLRQEAARLAGGRLGDLFERSVLSTEPPPLEEEAPRAGLELVRAGTGQPFYGMALAGEDAVITHIFENGPAQARGLRVGDRIVAIDQQAVASSRSVTEVLSSRAPGDAVEIEVQSKDGEMYSAVLDVWERTDLVLRRIPRPALAAATVWRGLTRGEATSFTN